MCDCWNRSVEVSTMTVLGPKLIAFAIFGLVFVNSSVIPGQLETQLQNFAYNEDSDLTTRQLIQKYGYRGETHRVTTDDGYILEMHRITGPNWNPSSQGKQPVLVMHGILSSSADWVIIGPDRAFAYLLADEGYDVWLGNVRGNTFSRKHNKYSSLDKEYWQFSWHEIGCKDLPAMIDYILAKTNRQKLMYAGHSQGTTSFWVMASERPEYQDKVSAMFALAPVAYLTHIKSPFYRVISKFANNIEKLMALLGHYEFEPAPELLREIIKLTCDEEAWTQPVCTNVLFLIAGFGSDQLNNTMLSAILGHVPAGASVKQVIHYAQVINSRKFQQYNHGIIGNLKKYKRLRPPSYDLSKIRIPVSLHYSSNDVFSTPNDVDRLYKELGNPIGKFRVPHEKFSHLDFLWANDGKKLIYSKIIGMMEKYRE